MAASTLRQCASSQISGQAFRSSSVRSFVAKSPPARCFAAAREVDLYWGTPPTKTLGSNVADLFWKSPLANVALSATGGSREGRSLELKDPILEPFLNGPLSCISEEDCQALVRDVLVDDCYTKVLDLLPAGPANIVDVGANIGIFAVWLASKKPGSTVLCCEPMPQTFAALSQNVTKMKSKKSVVKPVPMGLAAPDRSGKITFTHFEDVPTCSTARPEDKFDADIQPLLKPSNFANYYRGNRPWLVSFVERLPSKELRAMAARMAVAYLWRCSLVDVNLGTLDDAYQMAELAPPEEIDLLKVDVEGLEMGVLRSIPDAWWPKIKNCLVIVHDIAGRLEEMKSFLAGRAFTIEVQSDDYYNDEVGMNYFMLIAQK